MIRLSVFRVTVAWGCLCLCACDIGKVSGTITTVEAVLNALLKDKNFVEQAAREVKRGYSSEEPTYIAVSELYSQARAAHEAFLQAIISTANVGTPTPALAALANIEQKQTAGFLQAVASALSKGERGMPDISSARLLTSPTSPTWEGKGLSKAKKLAAARQIDRETRWRAWDAL